MLVQSLQHSTEHHSHQSINIGITLCKQHTLLLCLNRGLFYDRNNSQLKQYSRGFAEFIHTLLFHQYQILLLSILSFAQISELGCALVLSTLQYQLYYCSCIFFMYYKQNNKKISISNNLLNIFLAISLTTYIQLSKIQTNLKIQSVTTLVSTEIFCDMCHSLHPQISMVSNIRRADKVSGKISGKFIAKK